MNAIAKNSYVEQAKLAQVTSFERAKQRLENGQSISGYALMSPTEVLAVIETVGPDARLEELLTHYVAPPVYLTARELMRDLLNAEDYRSRMYDNIVRVHYSEDFADGR